MPFNDYANRPSDRGSLAQISTLVEEIRSATDHPVMVLDSGDTLQGTPFEQFTHVRWGEPSPTIDAMNRIGYQAMAIGNHEFNFGRQVLERAREQADFPFLSANILNEGTGKPAYQPYAVFEQGPIRVGVLGLITPNVPGWEKPENYRGLVFEPMDEAARRWVPVLREKENCDVVVVLAHTGFEQDPDSGEADGTAHENFIWRLTAVPGIDVLLTGHTHEDIPPRLVRGVFVAQPWARARMLTRIDLSLERDATGWHITNRRGENIPAKGVAADDEMTPPSPSSNSGFRAPSTRRSARSPVRSALTDAVSRIAPQWTSYTRCRFPLRGPIFHSPLYSTQTRRTCARAQ